MRVYWHNIDAQRYWEADKSGLVDTMERMEGGNKLWAHMCRARQGKWSGKVWEAAAHRDSLSTTSTTTPVASGLIYNTWQTTIWLTSSLYLPIVRFFAAGHVWERDRLCLPSTPMWYLLTTRHLWCVSEMRGGRGGSQTSSTVGTFKYLTLTLTWQDLQGGKCKGVWKKSAYQPVSNSAKDTDTDNSKIKTPIEANVL